MEENLPSDILFSLPFSEISSPLPQTVWLSNVSAALKKKKILYKISNQSSRKTWGLSLNKSKELQWINGYILIKLQMQVTGRLTPKLEVQCLCRQPGWGIIILHPLQSTCLQHLYILMVIPVEFFSFFPLIFLSKAVWSPCYAPDIVLTDSYIRKIKTPFLLSENSHISKEKLKCKEFCNIMPG